MRVWGAHAQGEVFTALNNALTPLGIRVTNPGNDQWSISDGRSLTRFHDGVVRALPLLGLPLQAQAVGCLCCVLPGPLTRMTGHAGACRAGPALILQHPVTSR